MEHTPLELHRDYYQRGLCYETFGDLSSAHDDFEEALRIRPNYESAQTALDRVEAALAQTPTAGS